MPKCKTCGRDGQSLPAGMGLRRVSRDGDPSEFVCFGTPSTKAGLLQEVDDYLRPTLQTLRAERDALQARLDALTPGVVRIPEPTETEWADMAWETRLAGGKHDHIGSAALAWARTHAEVVVVEAVGPVMEALAEMEHQRGSEQAQKALFDLTGEWRERWTRQAATPYQDLSEEEKEQDREQVRRIFSRLRAMQQAGRGVVG